MVSIQRSILSLRWRPAWAFLEQCPYKMRISSLIICLIRERKSSGGGGNEPFVKPLYHSQHACPVKMESIPVISCLEDGNFTPNWELRAEDPFPAEKAKLTQPPLSADWQRQTASPSNIDSVWRQLLPVRDGTGTLWWLEEADEYAGTNLVVYSGDSCELSVCLSFRQKTIRGLEMTSGQCMVNGQQRKQKMAVAVPDGISSGNRDQKSRGMKGKRNREEEKQNQKDKERIRKRKIRLVDT